MIFFIEGARNVGKTYLLSKVDMPTYKFPFKKFYETYESYSGSDINDHTELFYTTIGYDITLLDLVKTGQIKHNLIVDRGLLSDIIFGIQSGRTDKKTCIEIWNYLMEEYGDCFKTIYIYSSNKEDNRNKDMWSFYDIKQTHNLYLEFMDDVDYEPILFKNNYDKKSENKFLDLF